jgi:pilus assembly protein CpaE
MEQLLRLALITNDHFRAEATAGAAQSVNWHLDAAVGQPQPVAWLRRVQADVVLVDLDMPNAIALLREIAGALPHLSLLALVTPQHLVELQDALLAGAGSFVAFPLDVNQFTGTVLRTIQETPLREKRAQRGKLVVIAGLKGGVGRTTLAVNLAVALRQRISGEVVLVEAHHGLSDLSLNLNLLPRHTLASLAQENNIDADVIQGHLQAHASRLKVLAAPPDLSQIVEIPAGTWRAIFSFLAEIAAYVVIDTSAVADAVLSEALTMADEIVIVTGPDLAGLRSTVVLLQSLDGEAHIHARSHVVLNRAGVRGGVSESACAKQIGEPIAVALPDDAPLATFALNRGVPFVLSHPRAILSRKVQELVTLVFDLKSAAPPATPKPKLKLPNRGKSRTVQQAIAAD